MSTKKSAIEEVVKFRAGSKKNKVYSRFVQAGEAAAYKYGRSVGLAESSLKQWLKTWARELGTEGVKTKRAEPALAAEKKAAPKKKAPKKKAASEPIVIVDVQDAPPLTEFRPTSIVDAAYVPNSS